MIDNKNKYSLELFSLSTKISGLREQLERLNQSDRINQEKIKILFNKQRNQSIWDKDLYFKINKIKQNIQTINKLINIVDILYQIPHKPEPILV